MDHGGAPGITENGLDLRRLAAGDPAGVVGIVAYQAAGNLAAGRADDRHRVAAAEEAGNAANASGKQALAGPEGDDSAVIDMQFAGRLQLPGNPGLAGGHGCARWREPRGTRAAFDCR